MGTIDVELSGSRKLGLRLNSFPDRLRKKLLDKITELTEELEARVKAAAPYKTGELVGDIYARVFDDKRKVVGRVAVGGDKHEVVKGGALEWGGKNRAFEVAGHNMRLDHVFETRLSDPFDVFVAAYDRTLSTPGLKFIRGPADASRDATIDALREVVGETVEEDADAE